MTTLHINYDNLKKLESLPDKIKADVIRKSLFKSIFNTTRNIQNFSAREIRKTNLINFSVKATIHRIKLSKIQAGKELKDYHASINYDAINEALSSFPTQRQWTIGTDEKFHVGFLAKVLGRTIMPLPKTFLSPKSKYSYKRVGKESYPLKKAYVENSSISDVVRYENLLLSKIIDRTKLRYEAEIKRNIQRNLYSLDLK